MGDDKIMEQAIEKHSIEKVEEKEKWIYSFDEEQWGAREEFETKELAIAGARADEELVANEFNSFWVGKKIVVGAWTIDDIEEVRTKD
jgi:hypothetical protein